MSILFEMLKPSNDKDKAKFSDPHWTAKNERRAWVNPDKLKTFWVNTGTLCNLECANCYIESSPRNDRLVYLKPSDLAPFLEEIHEPIEIGFTGGEPFLNPDIFGLLRMSLEEGHDALVLTNAMLPMQKKGEQLLRLHHEFPQKLKMRVSLDHFLKELHDKERGSGSFASAVRGLQWLSENSFDLSVAGRLGLEDQNEDLMGLGFQKLFEEIHVEIPSQDRSRLVLFPEMEEQAEVPEITTGCWEILKKDPKDVMCASSRMLVKHKGQDKASVMACTLLPYDKEFEMGTTLKDAWRAVPLNHPHCSKFCVLGGASCS